MSGSNSHEWSELGAGCPHPLLIFNDDIFVWQIFLQYPGTLTADPILPPPPTPFICLLGVGKPVRQWGSLTGHF